MILPAVICHRDSLLSSTFNFGVTLQDIRVSNSMDNGFQRYPYSPFKFSEDRVSRVSVIHNRNEMTGRNRTALARSGCGDFTEKLVDETFFVCDQAHAQWPIVGRRIELGKVT